MLRSVLICLGVLMVSLPVLAQDEPPQVVETGATFYGEIARGHEHYKNNDFEGAFKAYEAAKDKDPGNPMAYYFLGCTQIKMEKYDEASVTLRAVTTMAGEKRPSLHAKALFLLALLEEMRGQLVAAKDGWIAYKTFIQSHKDAVGYVGSADARIEAIDKKKALDEKYKIVQDRIASSK